MKKKRALTLLEIMIVIFLIGLIGSVIGYNMKGSLEEGKAFKTEQAQAQIQDILELSMAKGIVAMDQVAENAELLLTDSGLVKDPKKMLKDGWNEPFTIRVTSEGKITISSKKLKEYRAKKSKISQPVEENNEEE